MKKDLYDVVPLDKIENELINDNVYDYTSIENLESEKLRYQKITKSSVETRKLLEEAQTKNAFKQDKVYKK